MPFFFVKLHIYMKYLLAECNLLFHPTVDKELIAYIEFHLEKQKKLLFFFHKNFVKLQIPIQNLPKYILKSPNNRMFNLSFGGIYL